MKQNLTFVFVGDSITDGNRGRSMDPNHIMGHGYAQMASAEFGLRHCADMPRFVNKGVTSTSLTQMYGKFEEDVFRYFPDVLTVLIGINNSETIEEWAALYEKMVREVKERLPDCLLVLMEPFFFSILPDPEHPFDDIPHRYSERIPFIPGDKNTEASNRARAEKIREKQQIVRDLCVKYHVIDIPCADILQEPMKLVPTQYIVWDGIHPTLVGHRALADAWISAVEPVLAR